MAYKQTPGRSPFPKTGRDIPLNFLSPLHNHEKGHPDDTGENALGANISEADIMNNPALIKTGGDLGVRTLNKKEKAGLQKDKTRIVTDATGIRPTGGSMYEGGTMSDATISKTGFDTSNKKYAAVDKWQKTGGKAMFPGQ